MGLVVKFPEAVPARTGRYVGTDTESATVIILPVIRIERHIDEPSGDLEPGTNTTPGRRRRRRASRA